MAKTVTRTQEVGLAAIQATGSTYIIGVDEVGTGCLAGPFVVAAVVCRKEWRPNRSTVRDSKKMSAKQRKEVVRYLQPPYIEDCWIIKVEPEQFSQPKSMGIALEHAIQTAANDAFSQYPDSIIVIDGERIPKVTGARCLAFPKADDLVPAVSAASIIAKVFRDELMEKYDEQYPEYGFSEHKGYGTNRHLAAIRTHGICPIHRTGYRPIQEELKRASAKKLARLVK